MTEKLHEKQGQIPAVPLETFRTNAFINRKHDYFASTARS